MEFDIYPIITILVVLAALFGYINTRYLKLPFTIGLMMISVLFSLLMMVVGIYSPGIQEITRSIVAKIDFSSTLLDIMLGFMLFAGGLHTDLKSLKMERVSIGFFSVVGVAISTVVMGSLVYALLPLLGYPMPYIYCLLFGALISPTDPIAVLGILSKSKVPEKAKINIVGESLFNDGIGVVVFLSIFEIAMSKEDVGLNIIATIFIQEALGGILFGLAIGFLMFRLLRSIDFYEAEVLITIAFVMGGYELSHILGVSGPLAMVLAGLIIGNYSRDVAMSNVTMTYVDKFWELVDILLNAILFVLIGFELMVLNVDLSFAFAALICIPLLLIARSASILVPGLLFSKRLNVDRKTSILMVWGGLRGGLSIAMVLSLPPSHDRDVLIAATYTCVLFSIIVQGLTVGSLANYLYKNDHAAA